jgi:hypothetical protein
MIESVGGLRTAATNAAGRGLVLEHHRVRPRPRLGQDRRSSVQGSISASWEFVQGDRTGLQYRPRLTYISGMLRTRPKKSAPQSQSLPIWSISRIKSTPAYPVGQVQAPDAESAIAEAIRKYDVPPQYHDRLLARRVR